MKIFFYLQIISIFDLPGVSKLLYGDVLIERLPVATRKRKRIKA